MQLNTEGISPQPLCALPGKTVALTESWYSPRTHYRVDVKWFLSPFKWSKTCSDTCMRLVLALKNGLGKWSGTAEDPHTNWGTAENA